MIINRGVNIGETVISAMSVTPMFLIAKDLKRIQVWALVNEADMGQIHEGLPVSFTVDALPGETFHGTVCQIRLNATSTSNVVTYTVVVATDNSDMKLLPYLTANIQFEVEKRPGVLQVPNAALRWKPRPAQIAPDAQKRPGLRREVQGRPGGQGGRRAGQPAGPTRRRTRRPSRRPRRRKAGKSPGRPSRTARRKTPPAGP